MRKLTSTAAVLLLGISAFSRTQAKAQTELPDSICASCAQAAAEQTQLTAPIPHDFSSFAAHMSDGSWNVANVWNGVGEAFQMPGTEPSAQAAAADLTQMRAYYAAQAKPFQYPTDWQFHTSFYDPVKGLLDVPSSPFNLFLPSEYAQEAILYSHGVAPAYAIQAPVAPSDAEAPAKKKKKAKASSAASVPLDEETSPPSTRLNLIET